MGPVISALRLQDFRCFAALSCELPGGLCAFVGQNAQGKTSILEAVCVLLRLQSPRARGRGDLVRFGAEAFGVAGDWDAHALKVAGARQRRELWLDGVRVEKASDYLKASGLVVWMGSEDRDLVKGGGEGRRRYLDFLGAQASPSYREASRAYERALRSRNALLRGPRPDRRSLDAYGAQLVRHGESIAAYRADLIARLGPLAAAGQRAVSGSGEALELEYRPNAAPGMLASRLAESFDADLRRGATQSGPHRDDLVIRVNGRAAGSFASEGQQRTVALALKLAQFELLRSLGNCLPVLLVDDVFGELDPGRRNALFGALPQGTQTLVTTTHLDWVDAAMRPEVVYRVEGAAIRCQG